MLVEGSYKEGSMPNSLIGHLTVNRGGYVCFCVCAWVSEWIFLCTQVCDVHATMYACVKFLLAYTMW